jgi:phosphoenolpyruvate carboxylase
MVSILDKLTERSHAIAIEKGIITQAQMQTYQEGLKRAQQHHLSRDQGGMPDLETLITFTKSTSEDDRLAFSRVLALDYIIFNSVQNAENAKEQPTPKERFLRTFDEILTESKDVGTAIDQLLETKDKMIISLTHTMHPTIYHNAPAREVEGKITRQLEALGDRRQESAVIGLVADELGGFMDRLLKGEKITPLQRVTVNQETMLESENLRRIGGYIDDVIVEWNAAVEECCDTHPRLRKMMGFGAATPEAADRDLHREKFAKMAFTPAEKDQTFEIRTWGRGADADGREQSTSILLYRSIQDGIEGPDAPKGQQKEGAYVGPMLDLRQNAEVHENYVSALIQRAFRQSAGTPTIPSRDGGQFMRLAVGFMKEQNEAAPEKWKSPYESIYQELKPLEGNGHGPNLQAEFLKRIIENSPGPFALIPEQVKTDVLEFNRNFYSIYRDFLKSHGLPETTTFTELGRIGSPHEQWDNLQMELRDKVKRECKDPTSVDAFFLTDNGLGFQRDNYEEPRDFLLGRKKLDKAGNQTDLTHEDRITCMDVAKRMIVINDAIDRYGPAVSNRYQIANFAGKEDFYEMLLLMKETGLVTIEKGRVTQAKMGIQPLIETVDDMRRAVKNFRELLEDPLVLSYYQARPQGIAEFMVGFSDGAKSAGNFASQWEIHKLTEELTDLFEAKGIKTRFFEGRGRGVDRGGTLEAGISRFLMPDNVNLSAVDDRTIQSDLPMDLANSPAYGKDNIASMMVGVIKSRHAALNRSAEETARLKAYEPAIDFVAQVAADVFQKVVRFNPDVDILLENIASNPDIASRAPKRVGTAKVGYEQRRAIPVEAGSNEGDLEFHNAGTNTGLTSLREGRKVTITGEDGKPKELDGNIPIPGRDGKPLTGMAALQALCDHPFFGTIVPILQEGIAHSHEDVSRPYGKATGADRFVDTVISEMQGLAQLFRDISGNTTGHAAALKSGSRDELKSAAEQMDIFAHALILSFSSPEGTDPEKKAALNPNPKRFPDQAETIRNALFCAMQELGRRQPSDHLKDMVHGTPAPDRSLAVGHG